MNYIKVLKEMLVEAEQDIQNTKQWLMEELESSDSSCLDHADEEWAEYKDALSRYATIHAIIERIEDESLV